ncbi:MULTISPECIES: GntR family transcriptional regulator [Cupriavidus]|uniref:GntR family transcriptional regulator n=1 Tax=Cupriavidus sp. WS TaxID=1312922 RepID=UPI000372F6C1|nr:GntR family transcriptional regulator [Cupriavidus sp. WS]
MERRSAGSPRARTETVSENERAYAGLRERLTTLVYRPGEHLNISTLVDDLEIGRTPINQALHRLANEGLVQILPRKGVVVAPLSLDDALHLIDVRLANETLCARLAAERVTAQGIAALEGILRELDAAVARRDLPLVTNLDRLFHEEVAQLSGNPILIEILKVLHARSQRFWAISLSSEGHLGEVGEEHRAILQALRDGDGAAAASAVTAHVLSFRQALLQGRREPVFAMTGAAG